MSVIWTGIAFVIVGLAIAGHALWKVAQAQVDGPAEQIGPCIYPFVLGMAIAIVGGFVLLGQWIWRLIA